MSLRWLWLDHIPPELGLNEQERRSVLELARRKRIEEPHFRGAGRASRRFLFPALTALSIIFTGWILLLISKHLKPQWYVLSNVGSILAFNALIWSCIAWAMYRANRHYIRWALGVIKRPVCMECGYILTGADDASKPCPECGAKRDQTTVTTSVS